VLDALLAEGFVPFAFGSAANLDRLNLNPMGIPLKPVASDRPGALMWHELVNRMNGLAYGGKDMGMPAWVQIDCGVLPSAFIGIAAPRHLVPDRLAWDLDLRGDEDIVPVAEAISIPTAESGVWSSFSMCSVLPGYKLGFLSKVLSLAAYRANATLGVAQFDNFALRIHTRFGELEILEPHVPFHTRSANTFVYRCEIGESTLQQALGPRAPTEEPSFLLGAQDTARMEDMAAKVAAGTHRYWLMSPGARRTEHGVVNPIREQRL